MENLNNKSETDLNDNDSNAEQIYPTWEEHQNELVSAGLESASVSIADVEDPADRERKLREIRSKISEITRTNAVKTSDGEQVREELIDFDGVEIPREMLGMDKVLVRELRERSKFDYFGRAKDKKVAQRLLDGDYEGEEELKELFTPTVARAYLDIRHENELQGCYLPKDARVFEALPLNVQAEELLLARECLGSLNGSHESVTLANKAACGLIGNLEHRGVGRRISKQDLGSSIVDQERSDKKISNGEPVADLLSGEVSQKLFSTMVESGFSKFDSATVCLKSKQMIDNLEWLMDRDIRVDDATLVRRMIDISEQHDGAEYNEYREKYGAMFPPEIRRLSEVGGLYGSYTFDKAKEVLEELDSNKEKRESLKMDENSWINLKYNFPAVYEQVKHEQVDDGTACVLRVLTKSDLSQLDLGMERVKTLEDVKNIDNVFKEAIDQSFEWKDYDQARNFISLYAFGMGLNDMIQNLVSLGTIEVVKSKKSGEGDGEVEFGKDKIKIKDLSTLGEVSEEQRLLLLDMIALCGCKDSGLSKKMKTYEENHISFEEKEKFVELLDVARKTACERITENYSRYMQEKLQSNSRIVGELEYDGTKVPLLKMEGEEFMLLIHRLGAFAGKNRDNPAQWNEAVAKDAAGKEGVGYISTAAIANGALRLANIKQEELANADEVFYSFTKLGNGSIKAVKESDAHTTVEYKIRSNNVESVITTDQDYFYEDPRELIKKNEETTKDWRETYRHSEVVLDRYSGDPNQNGGRLQPNQVVVFTDDPAKIGDLPKKHAAYFGIPILMVDPNKYS